MAVSDRGQAYRLTQRALSHEDREISGIMGVLSIRSLCQAFEKFLNAVHEKRQRKLAGNSRTGPGGVEAGNRSSGSLRRTGQIAEKVLGQSLVWVANAFESLLAQSISPEERQLAAVLEHRGMLQLRAPRGSAVVYDRGR